MKIEKNPFKKVDSSDRRKCTFQKDPVCKQSPRAPAQKFRVARWFVFKPKIPNLGKFWRAFE
jgi:hypothetical protein